jgi:hypothetical protein
MPASDPRDENEPAGGPAGSGGTALDALAARYGWKRIGLVVLGLCAVIAPPVIWAASGGSSKSSAPRVGPTAEQAAAAGCELHDFKYAVTNEPGPGRAYQREALFGNHPPLPRSGWQAGGHSPSLPVVLHTLAHGWLVVKYNNALDPTGRQRLQQFARSGGPDVAVVPGGPQMASGFAAIRWGHGLDCADAGVESLAVLRKFERLPPKLD